MASCPNNPVLGRNLTDNFDFNETTKQIVPKPGTDTKPGALALNLGNAAGDTTNATDALTAAGFNAMANAVDSTAPLCGNEIQQAVTAAVAQSIGCDADAQEAIACAIASNPDAVACLAAALPSGCDDSGTLLLDAAVQGGLTVVKWEDGVATQLTSPLFPGFGAGDIGSQRNMKYQNPGNFTNIQGVSLGSTLISLDTTTLVYASADHPQKMVAGAQPILNHEGTRLAFRADYSDPAEMFIRVYDIGANGRSLTLRRSVASTNAPGIWLGENLVDMQGGPLNIDTGAVGTVAYDGYVYNSTGGPNGATGLSNDYSKAARVDFNTVSAELQIRLWSIVRSGDAVTFTQTANQTFTVLPSVVQETDVVPRAASFSWSPDNTQLIVSISGTNTVQHALFALNIEGGTASIEQGGISVWGENVALSAPKFSADGKFFIMNSGAGTIMGAGTKGTAIFKQNGKKWRQIGFVPNSASTIVGGVAGYSFHPLA